MRAALRITVVLLAAFAAVAQVNPGQDHGIVSRAASDVDVAGACLDKTREKLALWIEDIPRVCSNGLPDVWSQFPGLCYASCYLQAGIGAAWNFLRCIGL